MIQAELCLQEYQAFTNVPVFLKNGSNSRTLEDYRAIWRILYGNLEE